MASQRPRQSSAPRTSTVGRNRNQQQGLIEEVPMFWADDSIQVHLGDSLNYYNRWPTPTVIISDGGYGVLGFEGDPPDHKGLPEWYRPHVEAWSEHATPATTLWFWNSEIGWASVHPILEEHGWQYVNANIWNKGKGHIAGNVNTGKIRRFPVVSEICVQYTYEAKVDGLELKQWLLREWKRTGMPLRKANEACGVADAAVRKYLDQTHLWYPPTPETFEMMQHYANTHGDTDGKPYFSINGTTPAGAEEWAGMRAKFDCPHGFTNVWDRPALRGKERCTSEGSNGKKGKAIHLNQKPLDLVTMLIEASSSADDTVWEPFGGLFTACIAARATGRVAFGAETDNQYFGHGIKRLEAQLANSDPK